MTAVLAICVGVTLGISVYMLLGRELKGILMGIFLLGHAAHLSMLAMSGSPVQQSDEGMIIKKPPVLTEAIIESSQPLTLMVDPLPQALILTAIVIGFAMMGFTLTLIVQTARATDTLDTDELKEQAEKDIR